MPTHPPIVMTFAATDPTGGAGLQADVLTLASLGCHPVSVTTAITVQDTHGVRGVRAIEANWVIEQARALLDEMPVAAFKLGVLGSVENSIAVAELIAPYRRTPLVLDPVLASGRGDSLASEATIKALLDHLLPLTMVLTPNSVEARRLAGASPDADLDECAARLIGRGAAYVLITGTHEPGAEVANTLYGPAGARHTRRWQRLVGTYHGSGCTLASAIAAQLAHGLPVPDAVRVAQEYTWRTLAGGFRPAAGQHIPDRLLLGARREARSDPMTLRGLYAITPDDADTSRLEERVRTLFAAAAKGCAALQYRNKSAGPELQLEQARRLAVLARASGVPFIVNDNIELAAAVGADGVHLGREDGEIVAARHALPGKLLGVSCYDSLAAARAAVAAGADYVAFGSVFPSGTKPGAVRAPLRLFREASALGVPLVAIGGITLENAGGVLDAGADALAVISALFDAPDIGARARAFARLFAAEARATP